MNTMFQVNLKGGGADLTCRDCLPEAESDRSGQVVSIAVVDTTEQCVYCGRSASDDEMDIGR